VHHIVIDLGRGLLIAGLLFVFLWVVLLLAWVASVMEGKKPNPAPLKGAARPPSPTGARHSSVCPKGQAGQPPAISEEKSERPIISAGPTIKAERELQGIRKTREIIDTPAGAARPGRYR
jgi:hypothetical protein